MTNVIGMLQRNLPYDTMGLEVICCQKGVALMNIADKVLLLLSCLLVYLVDPGYGMDVAPFLIAVIISCLLTYYQGAEGCLWLMLLFIGICFPLPGLLYFLPLLFYDFFRSKWQNIGFTALLPILYHWPQIDMKMVMPLLLLGYAAILKLRADQQRKLRANYFQLQDSSREMALVMKRQNQELLDNQDSRISVATLNERNRIAREIHDNVGHQLSSSLLQIGALLSVTREEEKRMPLLTLKDTLSEAMDSIRQSVHNLYDESVDLYVQLEEMAARFTFCPLTFDYDVAGNPEKRLKYALIAIVKEALSNIVRHSHATEASITLREHPAFYQLVIRDNGQVSKVNRDNGIGLTNMQTRVEGLGGIIRISVEKGFALFISIPKKETGS